MRISTAATGSANGIKAASAGTVTSVGPTPTCPSGDLVKHPALLNIPVAVSAQEVNYNLPGVQAEILRLNGTVLAADVPRAV